MSILSLFLFIFAIYYFIFGWRAKFVKARAWKNWYLSKILFTFNYFKPSKSRQTQEGEFMPLEQTDINVGFNTGNYFSMIWWFPKIQMFTNQNVTKCPCHFCNSGKNYPAHFRGHWIFRTPNCSTLFQCGYLLDFLLK